MSCVLRRNDNDKSPWSQSWWKRVLYGGRRWEGFVVRFKLGVERHAFNVSFRPAIPIATDAGNALGVAYDWAETWR